MSDTTTENMRQYFEADGSPRILESRTAVAHCAVAGGFGFPGDRCMVFDHRLFVDDNKTPLTKTMQPATVVRRYGKRSGYQPAWKYPDLVDVIFDHDGRESRGHFTDSVTPLQPNTTLGGSCLISEWYTFR
jgi:hypothetical protein